MRTLRDGPSDRDDLRAATDASKATVARLLNEFEDRNWVVRDGHEYALTDPGTFVADEFLRLVDRMDTEVELRDVWQWFPTDLPGCTMSLFAEAVITRPDSDSLYRPIPRFVEINESARVIRGFTRSPKPGTYEVWQQHLSTGGKMDVILPSSAIATFLREVSGDVVREAGESGRLALSAHDSLPTNAGVGHEPGRRLHMSCRDDEGFTRILIDTDAPEAVAWAESMFEEIRSEARPVDVLERLDDET